MTNQYEQFVAERHNAIINQLRERGRVSVKTLSAAMDVSPVTIRKDLRLLEEAGRLMRTHGGAIPSAANVQTLQELSFHVRLRQQQAEKRQIGLGAASLVKAGDSIALDASTTAYAVVPHLKQLDSLTIVTNSLPIAQELFDSPQIQVFMPGGRLRRDSLSLVGQPDLLPDINLNYGFFGAVGIAESGGVTDIDPDEVAIKQAMIEHCAEAVILADSTKWGRLAAYTVIETEQIEHVISTDLADPELVERFQNMGVRVGLVDVELDRA